LTIGGVMTVSGKSADKRAKGEKGGKGNESISQEFALDPEQPFYRAWRGRTCKVWEPSSWASSLPPTRNHKFTEFAGGGKKREGGEKTAS